MIGDWLQEYDFTVTAGDRTVALDNGDIVYFPYSEGVSFSYQLTLTNSDSETNTLNGDWGKDEGEGINTNTILYCCLQLGYSFFVFERVKD